MRSSSLVRSSVLVILMAGACKESATGPSVPAKETYAAALNVSLTGMTKLSEDLYYKDDVVGTGVVPITGDSLRVTYSGYLVDGSKFDAGTFGFRLGRHVVIDGWDQGFVGMHQGGKRRLVIGSNLGYGPRGSGPIPPNATLVFDMELIGVIH